jgi:hypothetical protein
MNYFSKRITLSMLSLMLGVNVIGCQAQLVSEKAQIIGEVEKESDWIIANIPSQVTIPIEQSVDLIRVRAKSGLDKAGVSIDLIDEKGVTHSVNVRADELRLGWGALSDKPLPDAILNLSWPGKWPDNKGTYFVRPNMDIYNDARRRELAKSWDTLPAASKQNWTMEFRRTPATTQLWLNGQFMNELSLADPITSVDVKLGTGAALSELSAIKAPLDTDFLRLPTHAYSRPAVMADATVKLAQGVKLPPELNLPEQVGAGSISIEGLSRIPARSDDLVSFTWKRSAVAALSEARLFSVPLDTYSHAQLLCAAEESPTNVPSFTARLTRYGSSRGDAFADTTVTLPLDETKTNPISRKVGEVSYGPANARKTVPLWLVRVPLKNGLIADLLHEDKSKNNVYGTSKYLEFEVLDPIKNADSDEQFPPKLGVTGRTWWPAAKSSVHLFAAALERSPATLNARTNVPIQVLYASDKPEWRAAVHARVAGNYTVEWEFADIDGKPVASGKQSLALTADKPAGVITVPITVGNGWYATRFRLLDSKGEERVDQRSSFVFLPPDTRKAGFESPYGAWWFHWAHGGEPNIETVGPLLQRAGLRHSNLPESLPEETSKKYGVTGWAIPWKVTLKPTMQEMMDAHEAHIRKHLALWPSTDKIMVWWESGANGAPEPSEIWGVQPPPLTGKPESDWKFRIEYVTSLAKMVRAKFPNLKLQYGNDGSSLGIIAGLLRTKFPREYIDTIATEDLGQSIIPERAMPDSLQSLWFLRETARTLGYGDVPVTSAYEWMNRSSTTIGLKSQAEWHIRDALHAKAYGLDTIALGSVHDAGTGYFHSLWGAGGLTRRYPRMEPKPVYAAIATHTQVMDGAKFERLIPTGLLSLYLVEFRRGNEWIYSLWTPRGVRSATLKFVATTNCRQIDMYGREKDIQSADVQLDVSTAPQYLVTSSRLASVATGKSSFPDDRRPEKPFIIDEMTKAVNWELTTAEPKWMEQAKNIPHTTAGDFTLVEVNDEEMGPCLELQLKPKALKWALEQEFVTLKLKTPVVGPGPYKNAGFWVKGNGGWGDVKLFAQAEKGSFPTPGFISPSTWSGHNAISFDGWNYMNFPVGQDERWSPQGTVTGLIITMPQNKLQLTEMEKVPNLKIRFKNLSVH